MLWSPLPALKLGALSAAVVALALAVVTTRLTRRLPQAMAQLGSAQ